MKMNAGLWIDHRDAVILILNENGEEIKRINSEIEKHVRFSGGAQAETEEDINDRRFTNHLNKYYDDVIAYIRNASSILVFGPGEAKVELKKRLDNEKIKNRSVEIETVDKMTDNQIAVKIRQYFNK